MSDQVEVVMSLVCARIADREEGRVVYTVTNAFHAVKYAFFH